MFTTILYFTIRSSAGPGSIFQGARIWSRLYLRQQSTSNMLMGSDDNKCDLHDPNEDPLPAVRTEFGAAATIVYGWPSTGGVWVHEDCYGVELDFLGLDRFEPSATQRLSLQEDKFCERLERIGGRFYASEFEYNKGQGSRERHSRLWIGWPAGNPTEGLWVLKTQYLESATLGVSRIKNALTMEERCKAIEMLEGRYFESWDAFVKADSAGETA